MYTSFSCPYIVRNSQKNPLGKYTRYAYNTRNQIVRIWGEEGLGVVYHLESTRTGENLVLRTLTALVHLGCLLVVRRHLRQNQQQTQAA